MSLIYVVMPAYNEAANIETTIKVWHDAISNILVSESETNWKLVVCDDGSKDDTYSILQRIQPDFPHLEALTKPNSGHGPTILYLYRYAIANGCDFIFQTDSDGQTEPYEFQAFWLNREKYDFQIGQRTKRQDGFSRIVVTRTLRLVVRLTMGVYVKDANTPFRLMKADKLEELMQKIPQNFFLANVALSALAVKKGLSVGWRHITFKPRQGGINSINLKRICKIGWKAIGELYTISKNVKKQI